MSSDKSLLLVLDLRKKAEEESLRMWSDAKKAVQSFKDQLAQLEQFAKIYEVEMQSKSKNGLDMTMYQSYVQFLDKLEKIKIRQENGLKQLEQQEQRAQQFYLEKQKERKIIESLLEKHKIQRRIKEAKAEQKLADDLVSSKHARLVLEKN